MIGHCQDCQWWHHNAGGWSHHKEWGTCLKAETDDGKTAENTLAEAQDVGSYHAQLCTAPDFGCVLWERKEPP